jgi:hypothetical protein
MHDESIVEVTPILNYFGVFSGCCSAKAGWHGFGALLVSTGL